MSIIKRELVNRQVEHTNGVVHPSHSNGLVHRTSNKFDEFVRIAQAIKPTGVQLTHKELSLIHLGANLDWTGSMFELDNPDHIDYIASLAAHGFPVAHSLGNFGAISARPDRPVFEYVYDTKGRPYTMPCSVVTTEEKLEKVWALNKQPQGLESELAKEIVHAFWEMGPFGFLIPAQDHIPEYLTSVANREGSNERNVQIIGPGNRCASNDLYRRIFELTGLDYGLITSLNLSSKKTGKDLESAHWQMKEARKDFGQHNYLMIKHSDEARERARYPLHETKSVSILRLNELIYDSEGPKIILERWGSLDKDPIRELLGRFKVGGDRLGLGVSEKASVKQPVRDYGN